MTRDECYPKRRKHIAIWCFLLTLAMFSCETLKQVSQLKDRVYQLERLENNTVEEQR